MEHPIEHPIEQPIKQEITSVNNKPSIPKIIEMPYKTETEGSEGTVSEHVI